MKERHPTDFEVLNNLKFWTHASGNDGISIQPHNPVSVIETYSDVDDVKEVSRIRWNTSDRGAFAMSSNFPRLSQWYIAAG